MRILILGASYGSLFGVKCAAAGHSVDLVCRAPEALVINRDGAIVRFPVKGDAGANRTVDVNSQSLDGPLAAGTTDAFDPSAYDLVVLAMQEPHYRAADVRRLLHSVAQARVPCLSIMNMPPLPYLERIPAIDTSGAKSCYTDADVWVGFDAALVTLCSPDPQAVRLPDAPPNLLEVRLATNFKAARFGDARPTALLRKLEQDIDATRFDFGNESISLPVKLRVHESLYVPLAKWCMLLTGNYRCVMRDRMRSIADAVHADIDESRDVYQWVMQLCERLGANGTDLVPFDKYALAARSLTSPSSGARALAGGAADIERVDRLVQRIAAQFNMRSAIVDEVVEHVDDWLVRNRASVKA